MGGFQCYKLILCGNNTQAAMRSLTELGIKRSDASELSPGDFQRIVDFMEMVEKKGSKLAAELAGIDYEHS